MKLLICRLLGHNYRAHYIYPEHGGIIRVKDGRMYYPIYGKPCLRCGKLKEES